MTENKSLNFNSFLKVIYYYIFLDTKKSNLNFTGLTTIYNNLHYNKLKKILKMKRN